MARARAAFWIRSGGSCRFSADCSSELDRSLAGRRNATAGAFPLVAQRACGGAHFWLDRGTVGRHHRSQLSRLSHCFCGAGGRSGAEQAQLEGSRYCGNFAPRQCRFSCRGDLRNGAGSRDAHGHRGHRAAHHAYRRAHRPQLHPELACPAGTWTFACAVRAPGRANHAGQRRCSRELDRNARSHRNGSADARRGASQRLTSRPMGGGTYYG